MNRLSTNTKELLKTGTVSECIQALSPALKGMSTSELKKLKTTLSKELQQDKKRYNRLIVVINEEMASRASKNTLIAKNKISGIAKTLINRLSENSKKPHKK